MKLHKKRKHKMPQFDANDTLSDSIVEIEDKNIEQSTNQTNAKDVLMAQNSLGSSFKDVNFHIKLIIKWSKKSYIKKPYAAPAAALLFSNLGQKGP